VKCTEPRPDFSRAGFKSCSGRGGIRTRDPFYRIRAFQARALGQLCDPSPEACNDVIARRRRGRDSNPRWLVTTLLFESSTLNRSDTSPHEIVPKPGPSCQCIEAIYTGQLGTGCERRRKTALDCGRSWYAWQDSNLRPLGPQPNALSPELQALVTHDSIAAPRIPNKQNERVTGRSFGAEREGFEPSIGALPLYTLSRRAPSTARPSPQRTDVILSDRIVVRRRPHAIHCAHRDGR